MQHVGTISGGQPTDAFHLPLPQAIDAQKESVPNSRIVDVAQERLSEASRAAQSVDTPGRENLPIIRGVFRQSSNHWETLVTPERIAWYCRYMQFTSQTPGSTVQNIFLLGSIDGTVDLRITCSLTGRERLPAHLVGCFRQYPEVLFPDRLWGYSGNVPLEVSRALLQFLEATNELPSDGLAKMKEVLAKGSCDKPPREWKWENEQWDICENN